MVPPSDRCRYKTDKQPTGPFDRKHLLDYLEQKAKEDKDWEEAKPYKKEIRGACIVHASIINCMILYYLLCLFVC